MNKMPAKKTNATNSNLKQFLKDAKRGKFATIEKSSIKYSRIQERTEVKGLDTEEYYYSMS